MEPFGGTLIFSTNAQVAGPRPIWLWGSPIVHPKATAGKKAMSWAGFATVFAAFFLTHSIPVRPSVKNRIIARTGARRFALMYSALSLAMLALLIWSAGQAPYVMLWGQAPWQRHVVHLGMVVVCLILAISIGRPNPFSFGGARDSQFDPARPGIVRWIRHPILLALALWAGLHLLPNGDLAHFILFGVLCGFAIAGRVLVDKRKRRAMGAAQWQALLDATKAAPRSHASMFRVWPWVRVCLGLVAFGVLLLLHPVLIGVPAY